MAAKSHNVPTLYHSPWFSSSMPYQVLLELSIPASTVAVVELSPQQLKTDPQTAVYSPRRVLPFLVFPDGRAVVESAAIVLHLCETYDTAHALHPAPAHPHRPRFLQAVVFAVAEGYKTAMPVFALCYHVKKEQRDRAKLAPLKDTFTNVFMAHLVHELQQGKRTYYLGDSFSAADIVMGYILMTAEYLDEDLIQDPTVKAYHARLKDRPSYQKLFSA